MDRAKLDIAFTRASLEQRFGDPAYPDDAGRDIPILGEYILHAGEKRNIPSGIHVAIPEGFYGRITGRSSALRKRGIMVHEGIIDAGYRGELFSYAENVGPNPATLNDTGRIAQLIICPVVPSVFRPVLHLEPSARGSNGFGSSDAIARDPKCQWPNETQYEHRRHIEKSQGTRLHIYLGGPVDFTHDKSWRKQWREAGWPSINMYDPTDYSWWPGYDPNKPARPGLDEIYQHNLKMLQTARAAIFNFQGAIDGAYGFGSPIEIYQAIQAGVPVCVYLSHGMGLGLYLELWALQGKLIITEDADGIEQWLDRIAEAEATKRA